MRRGHSLIDSIWSRLDGSLRARVFILTALLFAATLAAMVLGAAQLHAADVERSNRALNLSLHFHALVLDGAYGAVPARIAQGFHATPPLEDEQVALLARTLQRRVTRYLQPKGRLPREHDVADELAFDA